MKKYRRSSFVKRLALEQHFKLTRQSHDKGPVHQCARHLNVPDQNGIHPCFSSGSPLLYSPWLELKFNCSNYLLIESDFVLHTMVLWGKCIENRKHLNETHSFSLRQLRVFFFFFLFRYYLKSSLVELTWKKNIAENMKLHGNVWFNINRIVWRRSSWGHGGLKAILLLKGRLGQQAAHGRATSIKQRWGLTTWA